MIDLILRHVIPAAYTVLPASMASPQASAMLLAIGLQESRFETRLQWGGPAKSFWQFELTGVEAVLRHPRTNPHVLGALHALRYQTDYSPIAIYEAIEHNDMLAVCLARCLLWSDRRRLPLATEPALGWQIYLDTWRPGKPHPETWRDHFAAAWNQLQRMT